MSDNVKRPRHPHPMQPIVRATDGVTRFQKNAIVEYVSHMLSARAVGGVRLLDYNELMAMPWSNEDRDQWCMLVGYSVSGLPYRSRRLEKIARSTAAKLAAKRMRSKRGRRSGL